MKRELTVLTIATVLLALSANQARSDVTVWFELVSSDASVVSIDEGPGKVLTLSDPKELTPFQVTARMRANNTGVSLYSASTTLNADYPVAVTSTALIAPPSGATFGLFNQGTYGPGDIATNFGGAAFTDVGYTGNNIDLGTLTFTIDPAQGSYQFGEITARVGHGLWANSDTSFQLLRFGAGPFADSGTVGAGESPVIRFLPEPATVGLLLIAAMPLIRRRKSAS